MSEKNEKVVDMNNGEPAVDLNDIKGTDFVEPNGKGRKVIKWVLSGLALLVSGVVGGLIGHSIGNGDDDDDNKGESSDAETKND